VKSQLSVHESPYSFNDWSAGKICAYNITQYIVEANKTVSYLIPVNSLFPIGFEKLSARWFTFLNSLNVFGSGNDKSPKWLFLHFMKFVDALDTYGARPFRIKGKILKTFMIWAEDGVLKDDDQRPKYTPSDPKEMK